MKTLVKVLAILLMLCCVLVLVPSGAIAEILEIPLDAARGIPPYEDGYLSDSEYEDPSIHVTIGSGEIYRTYYWYARVKIANASQLRTHMVGTFKRKDEATLASHAGKVKPVICIDGDNFPERDGAGFVARQGEIMLTACNKTLPVKSNNAYGKKGEQRHLDVLIIDDQGDLHILKQATNEDVAAFEGKIIQGFSFGPALIIDGVPQEDFADLSNLPDGPARRACIAQTGPLEYLLVVSEGPEDSRGLKPKNGLTIAQFNEIICSFGDVQNAYMLDGGSAAGMIFRGKPVNVYQKKSRPLKDILYFASAYVPDEEPEEEPQTP